MRLSPVAAAMLVALSGGLPAAAASRRAPVETVRSWAVERSDGATGLPSCRMTRTITDERGDAAGAVIVSPAGAALLLVIAERDWDFPSDVRLALPLFLDGKPVASPVWTGDGQTLRATLPDTLLPAFRVAQTLAVRAGNAEVAFAIPDFAAAHDALRRCEAEPPAIAAAPSLPPRARLASYTVGLALVGVLRGCAVTVTEGQRAAVEAKMATLRPEMEPYEPAIRAQITKSRGFACPSLDKEAEFREAMRRFIDLSPEDFVSAIDQQADAAPAPVTKP